MDGIASSKASLARRGVLGTARLAAAGAHDTLRAAAAHTLTHTFTHTLPRLRKALQNKDSALRSFLVKVLLGKDPLVPLEHVLDGLLAEGDGRLAALLPAPAYVKLAGGLDELALMQLPPAELHSYYAKHPQHKLVRMGHGARKACGADRGISDPSCNHVDGPDTDALPRLMCSRQRPRALTLAHATPLHAACHSCTLTCARPLPI